jgi:hypothetical protein
MSRNIQAPKVGSRCPFGKIDSVTNVAPGIWQVSTPSHGGYKVSSEYRKNMPSPWNTKLWFEEDCEWAIIVAFNPNLATIIGDPKRTLENYYPAIFEAVYSVPAKLENSFALRQENEANLRKNKYVLQSTLRQDNVVILYFKTDNVLLHSGRSISIPIETWNTDHAQLSLQGFSSEELDSLSAFGVIKHSHNE